MKNRNGHLSQCSYCAELDGDTVNSYFLGTVAGRAGLANRYLFTSESFVVFPSVGALVAGHLLIVPKNHITAMAFLNSEQLFELREVISEVASILQSIYKTTIIAMEHGVIDETITSSVCVAHAHLHMVPLKFDLVGSINKSGTTIDLVNLRQERQRDDDYLLYTNDLRTYYICDLDDLPPQYLRKVIHNGADLGGSWNWREDDRFLLIKKTIEDVVFWSRNIESGRPSNKWLQPTLLTSRRKTGTDHVILE